MIVLRRSSLLPTSGVLLAPASASKDACLAFLFVPLVAADTEASGVFEMLDREDPGSS